MMNKKVISQGLYMARMEHVNGNRQSQDEEQRWRFLLSSAGVGSSSADVRAEQALPTPGESNRRALAVLVGTSLFTSLAATMLPHLQLGKRALLALSPLVFTLVPYYLCLGGGLPLAGVGSWKSVKSIGHRFGGIGALCFPILMVVYEALTSSHVPMPFYLLSVITIACNLIFGMALIPRSFPAYDIPAARGLAVGTLYGWAFLGWSLTFRVSKLVCHDVIIVGPIDVS